jgi:hypothetical protein
MSIDDCKLRCLEFGKPLLAAEQVCLEMDVCRRLVTHALFQVKEVECLPGFWTIENKCNMDPTLCSMPVLSCAVCLGHHCKLKLPELHLVQMSFQVLPNTCTFFGIASEKRCCHSSLCHFNLNLPELHPVQMSFQVLPNTCTFFEKLLHLEPSQIPDTFRKGCGFGHLLASIIVDLFQLTREAKVAQAFWGFNDRREPSTTPRVQWEDMCHETTVCCMHVFAACTKPPLKKMRRSDQHQKTASTVCDIWEGVGVLTANHSINQKACLGFLPAWCQDLAMVDPNGKVVKIFNNKFELKRNLNWTELDRFLATPLHR